MKGNIQRVDLVELINLLSRTSTNISGTTSISNTSSTNSNVIIPRRGQPRIPQVVLENPRLCQNRSLYLLTYVYSATANWKQRDSIRKSWGLLSGSSSYGYRTNKTLQVIFVLGFPKDRTTQRQIIQEHSLHGDILQGDHIDDYSNLTYSGLLAIKWIKTQCIDVKYVIKTDDDVFLNLFKITHTLEYSELIYGTQTNILVCPFANNLGIKRSPRSKWYLSEDTFPGKTEYPKYCLGLLYIFSASLFAEVYSVSIGVEFFKFEDVYFTGLVMQQIQNIIRVDVIFTSSEDLFEKDLHEHTAVGLIYIVFLNANETFMLWAWEKVLHNYLDRDHILN